MPSSTLPLLLLFLFHLLGVGCAADQKNTFDHDGIERKYRLHKPKNLPAKSPLIIVMHGYSGSAEQMQNGFGWVELADKEMFAVCFPDGTIDQEGNQFWNVGYALHSDATVDDTGFIVALTEYLQRQHDLDPERTFASGFSNGGDMSLQLAAHASDTFIAVGPVVGTMMEPLYINCTPEFPRPVIAFNGTDDQITRYAGDMKNADGWGPYESTPRIIELWCTANETTELEQTTLPDTDPTDGSTVELDRYWSKAHDREVRLYRVVDGGHDWPGTYGNMDIDATEEIWAFFQSVSPPPERAR